MSRVLYWSPRVIALLYAAFLSLFAFAALAEAGEPSHRLLHFAGSIPPTLVVLGALAVAWRRERIGAGLFACLGAAYVTASWGRFPLSTYVVIAGPLVVTAALFLASAAARPSTSEG